MDHSSSPLRRLVIACAIASAVAFCVRPLSALDIPLTGGAAGEGGMKIGYVDMERIFQVFPQTRDAKADYAEQLAKKREALAELEDELKALRTRLSILQSTLTGYAPADPEAPAEGDAPPEEPGDAAANTRNVEALRRELEAKEAEFEEARQRSAQDLAAFEKRQSQIILGKIYQALKELAAERQISLVVDKSSILFGSAEVDLTDDLQRRVRGF